MCSSWPSGTVVVIDLIMGLFVKLHVDPTALGDATHSMQCNVVNYWCGVCTSYAVGPFHTSTYACGAVEAHSCVNTDSKFHMLSNTQLLINTYSRTF